MHLADADGERMRMSDLAATVILSRSGLTRLVDRLEREGLIARESCPSDARGAFATLTPAGRRKLDAARATHLAGVRSLFLAHFSAEEQELLGARGSASSRASGPPAPRLRLAQRPKPVCALGAPGLCRALLVLHGLHAKT